LGLFVLVLSSTLLPPLKVLFVLGAVLAMIAWLFWRWFVRVYSKAQVALQESLAASTAVEIPHEPVPLPPALREANLETHVVASSSAATGKLIRELALRTRTGASIVG